MKKDKINFNDLQLSHDKEVGFPGDTKKIEPIKLDYPIIQIGKAYYQEKSPGMLSHSLKSAAIDRYGKAVLSQIEYYFGFINEPSHINYQRIIGDDYNSYKKISHIPNQGGWPTIKLFLSHIYKNGGGLQMALEYFWNLYNNPKQKMPFLGLVSNEKGTGKSTFLNFVKLIFEENASVVSAHDFKTSFNDHYASSLVIYSDEHAEGQDRITIAQKFKMMITETNMRVEAKFGTPYTSKCYFKIIVVGNDEEMLTFIEEENTRYWIIKIDPFEGKENDRFIEKLEKEIPAFLFYLANEFEARSSRGRLYFDPSEFQTEASRLIQENSKSSLMKEIEDYILDIFESNTDLKELKYAPKDLQKVLSKNERSYIIKTLKKMGMMPSEQTERYSPGVSESMLNGGNLQRTATGKVYTFYRKDFIDIENN